MPFIHVSVITGCAAQYNRHMGWGEEGVQGPPTLWSCSQTPHAQWRWWRRPWVVANASVQLALGPRLFPPRLLRQHRTELDGHRLVAAWWRTSV